MDAEFFEKLESQRDELNRRSPEVLRDVIWRSCRLKADVVEKDEYETTGLRVVLNYGHTFAHAYEALSGYSGLTHGEAVAIGMVHASRLAERLGRRAFSWGRSDLVAAGEPNKIIARQLGISFHTVELHRAHIIEKLKARGLSDLIRMAIILKARPDTGE